MAAIYFPSHSPSHILQLPVHSPSPSPSPSSHNLLLFTGYSLFRSPWPFLQKSNNASLYPVALKLSRKVKCLTRSTEESEPEAAANDGDTEPRDDLKVGSHQNSVDAVRQEFLGGSERLVNSSTDYPSWNS